MSGIQIPEAVAAAVIAANQTGPVEWSMKKPDNRLIITAFENSISFLETGIGELTARKAADGKLKEFEESRLEAMTRRLALIARPSTARYNSGIRLMDPITGKTLDTEPEGKEALFTLLAKLGDFTQDTEYTGEDRNDVRLLHARLPEGYNAYLPSIRVGHMLREVHGKTMLPIGFVNIKYVSQSGKMYGCCDSILPPLLRGKDYAGGPTDPCCMSSTELYDAYGFLSFRVARDPKGLPFIKGWTVGLDEEHAPMFNMRDAFVRLGSNPETKKYNSQAPRPNWDRNRR